jgi:integrase
MHRFSTRDIALGHIRNHFGYFNEFPVNKIDIDAVNDWASQNRAEGLSWVTIKNNLRTLQRVCSAYSKDKPPFSQDGLDIPAVDRMQMKIRTREQPSRTWKETLQIVAEIRKSTKLGAHRKPQYATYVLLDAAAAGRVSDILALRGKDIDFKASTNSDRRGFRPTEQGACGSAQEHRGSANSRAQGRSGTTRDEGTKKVCREIT